MGEKKSFLIYFDWGESLGMLSNDEMGALFWALFNYAKDGILPEFKSRGLDLIFYVLKGHIDRDNEKYFLKCEVNKKNAKLGGRPKKDLIAADECSKNPTVFLETERFNEKTNGYEINRTQAKKPDKDKEKDKDKDKDKDKENDNDINIKPPSSKAEGGYSGDFLRFWDEYPKKVGKAEAYKRYCKLKLDEADTDDILSSLKWQKSSEQWQRDGGRYIPNPSTYLSQKRWEDEPAQNSVGKYSDPSRYTDGDELPDYILNGGY